ncbi:MAG: DUF3857 domain-containing protein [Ignavibacteria bacterium]|nr:DUF3857 domain-containing protein [Ignavibacteria bacterium]
MKPLKLIIFSILFLLITGTVSAQDAISRGWDAIGKGDLQTAEKILSHETSGENAARAYYALSWIYDFSNKKKEQYLAYNSMLKSLKYNAPYLYLEKPSRFPDNTLAGLDILSMWEEASRDESDALLYATANESLGNYYLAHANPADAKTHFTKLIALNDWCIIGPFDNTSACGYNQAYLPETEFKANSAYTGKDEIEARWFKVNISRPDKWLDFTRYFPHSDAIFYANTFIFSETDQTVLLRIGTSGSFKAFINDALAMEHKIETNNDLDTYIAEIKLHTGWNRLLVKVGSATITECNFMARITDLSGKSISSIKTSAEEQSYKKWNDPKSSIQPHKFARFFEDKIHENPDIIDNYLLLAKIYSNNGDYTNAEILLNKALVKFPEHIAILYSQYEAFLGHGKNTEAWSKIERIDQIYKDLPVIFQLRYTRAMSEKKMDELELLNVRGLRCLPESEILEIVKFIDYSMKKDPAASMSSIDSATKKYPDNYTLLQIKTRMEYSMTRSYDKLCSAYEEFCKTYTSSGYLLELANYYLAASRIADWEKLMNRLIAQDSSASGYYISMARNYLSLQKFNKAERILRSREKLSPLSATEWALMGDIYAAQKNLTQCKNAYQQAIRINPRLYNERKKLRELNGSHFIGDGVPKFNIKELIADTAAHGNFPQDDIVTLLEDVRQTIYSPGASEYEEELLYKVLNKTGIKTLTEYGLGYNPNVQELILDKAVVIKKDGTEIEADRNDGNLVFKSLDINDYVYIKYKLRNYFSGKLSRQFWKEFIINGFVPQKHTRYTLIIPNGMDVAYKAQNFDGKPTSEQSDYQYKMLTWEFSDIPAIKSEEDMPTLEDVAKVLYISTIKDWGVISDWYKDITNSKIEPTYEIEEAVKEILKGKENASTLKKVQTIYEYIIEKITYSCVPFRQSAFVPQKARDVLINQIGDCKDMATLFVSMMKVINVDANLVLVNTNNESKLQNALPGIYFNHAIAEVHIDGKSILLDLTARDHAFGTLPYLDAGAFALDIREDSHAPYYIDKKQYHSNNLRIKANARISSDNSLNVQYDCERTGYVAAVFRNSYRDKDSDERIKNISESYSNVFHNLKVLSFDPGMLTQISPSIDYHLTLEIPNYLSTAGSYRMIKFPWLEAEYGDAALSYDSRSYNYEYKPFIDTLTQEISITVPTGFVPLELPSVFSINDKHATFTIAYSFENGVLSGTAKIVNLSGEITPEDYQAFKVFFNTTIEKYDTQILLRKK